MTKTDPRRTLRYVGPSDDVDRPLVGAAVADRMDQLRTEIDYIRSHWHRYPDLMAGLRKLVESGDAFELQAQGLAGEHMQRMLSEDREWIDSGRRDSFDLAAVQLYTTEEGYASVFQSLNRHLRRPATESWRKQLQPLVQRVANHTRVSWGVSGRV